MLQKSFKSSFSTKKIRIRILLVGVSYVLFFLLIGARAFELHMADNSKLSRLAENQYRRKVVTAPKRGTILDTHGDTLAIDIQVDSVYATPNTITDPPALAKSLASALNLKKDDILEKIQDKNRKFVWIKRRISPEESKQLKDLKLSGIALLAEYKRYYPNGVLAANLLGAVGYDAMALSGLEMAFDETLKSVDTPKVVEQDAKGRSYEPFALADKEQPNEIGLTIDKTIQYYAERELKTAVDKAQAKGGVALVMDVKTGEVLAMAVAPTFDPNEYSKYDFRNWRNRSITDIYEPGSIFKAFTAAAALETGVIDLNQTINCEGGAMQVGKFTIHDHHGYGNLKLSDIVKYSSNICSFKLAQRVGKKRYYDMVKSFGFGQKTGIETPGEVNGLVVSYDNLSALQLGTMAFGQGISVTPIQIAAAYCSIANGGTLMKPFIVKEIHDSKGQVLQTFEPQVVHRVISEKTAKTTARLLETVVEKGGTGTAAALEAYRVAGKTGTAQKVAQGHKGYAKNQYVASFVGFAPSRDPRLVVLVSIDEPKGDYYGGAVSAPVFREIMGQSLAYLKVAADQDYVAERGGAGSKEKKAIKEVVAKAEPPTKGKSVKTKPAALADDSPREALPSETVSGEGSEALAENTGGEESSAQDLPVPDFKGLSVREALRKAQDKNLKVQIKGSGICNRQEPQPGISVSAGTSVVIECEPLDRI